jgi:thiamine biosynthesis lipoprotein ApbE
MDADTISIEVRIARHAAKSLQGKDWHKLSIKDRELVSLLEKGEYLTVNTPANGFVGQSTAK